ncbi:CRISPR-associated protein Cas2 [Richelia sinica FACHB-800]|uniref:CRISPR-associated endoribonuclease Cas2 n=1 Tax=Richelia sinica FACHB-800 TaxID=1357546 RepID=A0A975TCE2_9NOST|nr:CRISPR-associated endonuclease Cas2 [Richelia sinica]MBD2667225.1 CRISPR-associated endonuclease Cas2 [Richelia sinica FACHB-800]QXE26119.1 CRISPR-associated protein Cas2 [Richelia sinica FACHB-800]
MFLYVISYDIPCDKRRKKVADLLEGYGQRVQYSVFECQLSTEKYQNLRRQLRKKLKLEEDNVRFYPLSRHTLSQVETWGVGIPVIEPPSSIII